MIKSINNYNAKINTISIKTINLPDNRFIPSFGKNHKIDTFERSNELIRKQRPKAFTKDTPYRIELANALRVTPHSIKNIIGANEFKWLLENKFHKASFLPGKNGKNIDTGRFEAGFHNHTIHSDGTMTPKEILEEFYNYSQRAKKPVFFSITDHNEIDANKEVIKLIASEPDKYKNVYFISGVEILSNFSQEPDKLAWFETLVYGLNPFNKETNKFIKTKGIPIEDGRRTFPIKEIGDFFNNKDVIMSVAHPQRIYLKNMSKNEFFKIFKDNGGKAIETYYTYSETKDEEWAKNFHNIGSDKESIKEISKLADKFNLLKTGGRDCHGETIFYRK